MNRPGLGRIAVALAAWALLTARAEAKLPKVDLDKVPAETLKAAQDRFPGEKLLWAKLEDAGYRFKFQTADGKQHYLGTAADGRVLYNEDRLKADELPSGVKSGIDTELGGAAFKDVRRQTAADGTVTYRLDTGKGAGKDRARVDSSGRILSLRNGVAGGIDARLGRFFTGRGFEEKNWEAWLAATAKTAKMTDEQVSKAGQLLDMAKSAAADYRKAKEGDYKRIAGDLAEIRKTPAADAEKKKALEDSANELGKPVDEIGSKWRADVLAMLTDEQRKALPQLKVKKARTPQP